MCDGCWDDYGRPAILTDAVKAAAETVAAVYAEPTGGMGGNLHCQLDDWNIEDEFFEGEEPIAYNHQITAAERACHKAFRALNLEERASALALHSGYIQSKQDNTR